MSIPPVSPPSVPPLTPLQPPAPTEPSGPSPLAERLKAARKAAGLSQQEVATKLEMHVMSVSGWERGLKVPLDDTLTRLAALYGISPADLRYGPGSAVGPAAGPVGSAGVSPRVTSGETGLPNAVRTWLQEELLQYTKAGVPYDAVREAQQLYESPEVFTFFRRGEQRERSEADVLKGMKGMSVAIRSTLADRGYKVGPNREE